MLLCQFLVPAGNRFWLYILLCTWSTIQLWCCVSFFGSGARSLLRPEKKSSSRLSGGCAITNISTTGPIYVKSSDFDAKLNVSNLNVTNLY